MWKLLDLYSLPFCITQCSLRALTWAGCQCRCLRPWRTPAGTGRRRGRWRGPPRSCRCPPRRGRTPRWPRSTGSSDTRKRADLSHPWKKGNRNYSKRCHEFPWPALVSTLGNVLCLGAGHISGPPHFHQSLLDKNIASVTLGHRTCNILLSAHYQTISDVIIHTPRKKYTSGVENIGESCDIQRIEGQHRHPL